jgi:two-component system OmpR family response regulator
MRILFLEGHATSSDAISIHLRAQGVIVDAAFTGGEFGAVLIDLALPDGNGLDLVSRLRRHGLPLPIRIRIRTARDRISDRIRGLEAGADDYLVKPFEPDEMMSRMHAVARRYGGPPKVLEEFADFRTDFPRRCVPVKEACVRLMAREWALLEKLSSHPGSLFSREKLDQAIYGFDDDATSNTLEVFIGRLRKNEFLANPHRVSGQPDLPPI